MCTNTPLRPRPRHMTSRQHQPKKGLALCFDATLASRHIGGYWSIPTVHRCPQGKAVGSPNSITTRQQDSEPYRTPQDVCQTLTWWRRRFVETADLRSNDSLPQEPKRLRNRQEVPQEIPQEIPQEKHPDNMFKATTCSKNKSQDTESDGARNQEVDPG